MPDAAIGVGAHTVRVCVQGGSVMVSRWNGEDAVYLQPTPEAAREIADALHAAADEAEMNALLGDV